MKRRIISAVLVIVTLVLSLVSCGYSYTKDDLTQYMSFNKEAFDATLASLEIKDGDFTTDEETRAKKIEAYIYDLLVKNVDTDDKLTTGTVNVNDQLHYCYYVTYTDKDGATVTIYPSLMKESNPASIKLGNPTLTGYQEKLREKVIALNGFDIETYVYTTATSGGENDTTAGKTAYISYKVTDAEGATKSYQYEKVVLGDENHVVAKALVGSTVGTALTENAENPLKDADGNVYTNAKINWLVKTGDEITFTYVEKEEKTVSDVVVGTSITVPADTELTYHVYPTYYYDVDELSAEEILKSLLSSLPTDSEGNKRELECLKDAADLLTELATKVSEEKTAQDNYDKAVKAKTDAEEDVEDAKGKVPAGEDVDTNTLVVDAKAALADAEADVTETEGKLNDAKTATEAKMTEIFKKAGADDEAAGKTKVVDEYREAVKDVLIEKYNDEIKTNVAKAVWAAMKSNTTVNGYPERSVKDIYNRMYEIHENTFYTESNETTKKSHYYENDGDFKKYLTKEMAKTHSEVTDFKGAKDALWQEACDYVSEIVIIYFVSDLYDLTYDKSEIKEYKKDKEVTYDYYKNYYGETNALAAYQFDALMNYFVDADTNEETGAVTYKNITYVIKAD